jgi:hypothetical protein
MFNKRVHLLVKKKEGILSFVFEENIWRQERRSDIKMEKNA